MKIKSTDSKQDFCQYIIEKHSKNYNGQVSADKECEDFEKWIKNLDVSEVINLAEEWGNTIRDTIRGDK